MTDPELNHKFTEITDLIDRSMQATATQFEALTSGIVTSFRKSHVQIDEIGRRLDSIESRLDAIEHRLDSLERRFDADTTWRDHAERRIKRLEVQASLPPLEEAA